MNMQPNYNMNNNIPQNQNYYNMNTSNTIPEYGHPQPNNNNINPPPGFNNYNNNLQGQMSPNNNFIPYQGGSTSQQNQMQGQYYGGQGSF